MSFPASPTNGEVTIINGVIYVYNDANGSWDRTSSGTTLPSNIANGNSNVRISANSNVTVSVAGTANVLTVTATSANISGNLSVTGDAAINDITATGNVTAVNVSASANLAAGNIATGNIAATGDATITGNANITGNILSASFQNGNSSVNIAANANVTITSKSNATVVVTDTGANISGTANISGNANVGNLGTTGLLTASGNVTGGNLVATNNIQINGNQIKSSTGNVAITLDDIDVTIAGNLIVSGSSTTINTATLDVEDLNITVAKGAPTAAAANGAGITVDGAAASLIYNNTSNTWVFDRGANVSGTLNVTGNANVANIGTGLVLATSNIVAGSGSGSANYYNIGSVGRAITSIASTGDAVLEAIGSSGNGGAIFLGNITSRHAFIQSESDNSLSFWTSYAGLGNAVSLAMSIDHNGAVSMSNVLSVTGNITTSAAITSTGNVAAGNLTTAGALSVTGNANTGNLGTTTVIATTANLTTINSGKMQNGNSNVVITPNGNVTVTSTSNATMIVTGTGVNIAGTANITSTLTTVGDIVISSGNAATSITTGALRVTGGIGTQDNLYVGGNTSIAGNLITPSTTQNVFNTTATTVNAFGAATNLNIGVSGGTTNIASAVKAGTGTYTKTLGSGDIALDNGTTDTPGMLMYYGNNNNWAVDSYNGTFAILSGQMYRVVNNLNEAGGAVKMAIDTTGNMYTVGFMQAGAWRAGQVINDIVLANSEVTISTTTVATSTSDTDFLSYSYTPLSNSSYLIIHVHVAAYSALEATGGGTDSYFSRIKVGGTEITYSRQYTRSGDSFRTGALFPLTGRYTNSDITAKPITVGVRRDSADDNITIVNSATALWMRITEIAR